METEDRLQKNRNKMAQVNFVPAFVWLAYFILAIVSCLGIGVGEMHKRHRSTSEVVWRIQQENAG